MTFIERQLIKFNSQTLPLLWYELDHSQCKVVMLLGMARNIGGRDPPGVAEALRLTVLWQCA